jgi:pimeloyl-ACP methyl ester carboxylesterase
VPSSRRSPETNAACAKSSASSGAARRNTGNPSPGLDGTAGDVFGLDEGVTTNGSVEGFPPSDLPPALRPLSYPNGAEPGTEYYIDPELFPEVFAADLPVEEAEVLAYSQRPASGIGFGEPLAVTPGWKKTPSWFIVAAADRAINPDSERAAAQRMGATMSEIDGGSHAISLSQPDKVTAVILEALQSIS